jgi:5-methylcytosine-specific restriction endonuclease McrA
MPSRKPTYKKKWKKGDRNWSDPRYVTWRKSVRARDEYTCQKCKWKPKTARSLVCHHIRRWADMPTLRFSVGNGITLCRKCHNVVTGSEDAYAPLFLRILAAKLKKGSNGDTKSRKG